MERKLLLGIIIAIALSSCNSNLHHLVPVGESTDSMIEIKDERTFMRGDTLIIENRRIFGPLGMAYPWTICCKKVTDSKLKNFISKDGFFITQKFAVLWSRPR